MDKLILGPWPLALDPSLNHEPGRLRRTATFHPQELSHIMKNRVLTRVLRTLITLLGAGLGILLAELVYPFLTRNVPALTRIPFFRQIGAAALAVVFGAVFFGFSYRESQWIIGRMGQLSAALDEMSTREVFFVVLGLIVGLAVAALASNLILAAGVRLFTLTLCALIYVACGWLGMHITRKRARRRRSRKQSRLAELGLEMLDDADDAPAAGEAADLPAKVIDSSALIDGRMAAVREAGFLEGELIVPSFVSDEMRRLADSAEEERRAAGRRGLDCLAALTSSGAASLLEEELPEGAEVDAALLRLCADRGWSLLTGDTNLIRAAAAARVKTLSLPALAEAMRPPVQVGEKLRVSIRKQGREPGQGVGYLPDGTMVVAENAASLLGREVEIAVTSVRGTTAGRMIFGRIEG